MSEYREDEPCQPQTTRTWNYGGWRDVTTCAAHSYFGNGIEPNDWPCHPDTRTPVSHGTSAWRAWLVGVMSTSHDMDARYRASEALAALDAANAQIERLRERERELIRELDDDARGGA